MTPESSSTRLALQTDLMTLSAALKRAGDMLAIPTLRTSPDPARYFTAHAACIGADGRGTGPVFTAAAAAIPQPGPEDRARSAMYSAREHMAAAHRSHALAVTFLKCAQAQLVTGDGHPRMA